MTILKVIRREVPSIVVLKKLKVFVEVDEGCMLYTQEKIEESVVLLRRWCSLPLRMIREASFGIQKLSVDVLSNVQSSLSPVGKNSTEKFV